MTVTRTEIVELLDLYSTAWPSAASRVNEQTAQIWLDFLNQFTHADLKATLNDLTRRGSDWPPSLSTIYALTHARQPRDPWRRPGDNTIAVTCGICGAIGSGHVTWCTKGETTGELVIHPIETDRPEIQAVNKPAPTTPRPPLELVKHHNPKPPPT